MRKVKESEAESAPSPTGHWFQPTDPVHGLASTIGEGIYPEMLSKRIPRSSTVVDEGAFPGRAAQIGIKYPFGKLDLIGLPDFSAGGMKNTGCITSASPFCCWTSSALP